MTTPADMPKQPSGSPSRHVDLVVEHNCRAQFGVDPFRILAIWMMEPAYTVCSKQINSSSDNVGVHVG